MVYWVFMEIPALFFSEKLAAPKYDFDAQSIVNSVQSSEIRVIVLFLIQIA